MNPSAASPRVAIQGYEGSFHHMAAKKFFKPSGLSILPCHTFKESFGSVKEGRAQVAVVAIENSLAGSLLPNYALLKSSGLTIGGETFLRVEQNLMALPGETLESIREIHSHPMAIVQCDDFLDSLRKKGVKVIDSADTALSARWIAENKLRGVAALASDLAASMYGLHTVAASVETHKKNFTRFLALCQADKKEQIFRSKPCQPDKASVSFSLPHKTGSLSQVLSVLAFYNMNLTKIQSAPIVGREWEYFFYVDLVFDDYDRYQKSLDAITPLIDQLQVLGEYLSATSI